MTSRRCALVSGASRGIGRAVAVRLAADGYDVGFCSTVSGPDAKETCRLVEAAGGRASHVVCDVRDAEAVRAFTEQAQEVLGPAHVVVSSAGMVRDRPLALTVPEDFATVLETNLSGTFHLLRSVVRGMAARRAGAIVAVSSVVGVHGNAGQTTYAASKGGVNAFGKALAKELAPRGVRVNVVAPGYVDTDMTANLHDRVRQAAVAKIPMGRFGTPESVADVVGFLASDAAAYVTGQVVQVDGGIAL